MSKPYRDNWKRMVDKQGDDPLSDKDVVLGFELSERFTGWLPFDMNGTWANVAYNEGWFRRVGDSMDIRGEVRINGTPTPSTNLRIQLPSGLEVDTSKIPSAGARQYMGTFQVFHTDSVQSYNGQVRISRTTPRQLRMELNIVSSGNTPLLSEYERNFQFFPGAFSVWTSGTDYVSFEARGIPISGWFA